MYWKNCQNSGKVPKVATGFCFSSNDSVDYYLFALFCQSKIHKVNLERKFISLIFILYLNHPLALPILQQPPLYYQCCKIKQQFFFKEVQLLLSDLVIKFVKMNSDLQESLEAWPQWIRQFEFDPTYGYLIDPEYKPKSFQISILEQILSSLSTLNQSGQIIQRIKSMPAIQIDKQNATFQDMVILHDYCSYLIHSLIKVQRDKEIMEQDMVIPKNLAMALAQSAGFLRIKTGMATGIGYNWHFNNQLKDLDLMAIDDIEIKYFYSTQKQYESLFFQVSVVTSYFLGRIIKNCYEINCIITQQPNLVDQVKLRMNKIKFYLKRIFEENLQIQLKMDKEFFFYVLRIFVAGYMNVYFEGIDQRVSSSGGAGGYDPSFQSFQRAFGLFFEDQIGNIQQKLRHGMPEENRNLIDFFTENSLIRQYCECTTELQNIYNEVLEGYVKYLQLHGSFIRNFIINMVPVYSPKHKYGENGESIIRIIEKFKFVRQQELTQKKQ